MNDKQIIDAVNARGGSLAYTSSKTDISNAIKKLNINTIVTGNVVYTYHHHTNNGSNLHINDNTNKVQSGSIPDNYSPNASGGCFNVSYHTHTDACYSDRLCGTWGCYRDHDNVYYHICSGCGENMITYGEGDWSAPHPCQGNSRHVRRELTCGHDTKTVTKICGYNDGAVTSAYITY